MFSSNQSSFTTGQDNIRFFKFDIHAPVFFSSVGLILAFVIFTLQFPEQTNQILSDFRAWNLSNFDQFMIAAVNFILLFCLMLMVMPIGSIRLGGDSAKPDFSRLSWMSMLFAAGMGIGLIFWSVAEPMVYFTDWAGTPLNVEAWTEDAAELAMAATVFHWGIHAWAIYAVVALGLAFFSYNCGLPLTMRSSLYPLLGDACWRWPGHIIDVFAVLATIFGLATSLGLGASQINAGLSMLFGIADDLNTKLVIILVITVITVGSVVRGLNGGVKVLSQINMLLAALLLCFVALVSSLTNVFSWLWFSTTEYLNNIVPLSNWIEREDGQWMQDWTVFYWAWWVSWSPFVGMFIARISKGRTVREFLFAVLVIPTLVTIVWMSIFGMNAIEQASGGVGSLANGVSSISLATFQMLENLPFPQVTIGLGMLLVMVFFITSSDSGSLVVDTITAGGKLDAPTPQRVMWALAAGSIASALLYGGGNQALNALQAGTIATGIPFTLVILLICFCLYKGLTQSIKTAK
jgi:BCCT family betaine/carnitine transporter